MASSHYRNHLQMCYFSPILFLPLEGKNNKPWVYLDYSTDKVYREASPVICGTFILSLSFFFSLWNLHIIQRRVSHFHKTGVAKTGYKDHLHKWSQNISAVYTLPCCYPLENVALQVSNGHIIPRKNLSCFSQIINKFRTYNFYADLTFSLYTC